MLFVRRALLPTFFVFCLLGSAQAQHVELQNATADASQNGFPVGAMINNVYPQSNSAGDGWAGDVGGTPPQIAVFETTNDLDFSAGGTIRFNMFGGWSNTHTLGRYRYSYTTDDRSTFADGLNNGGDVTANWVQITPNSATATNGPTLSILGDDSILASGSNPNRTTYSVTANLGPVTDPITGFRIETLLDPSLPTNGPGRAGNGNHVTRELDIAAFAGKQQVGLQNATALRSQANFSVDNVIDGGFPHISANNIGWANNALGDNVAVFETTAPIEAGSGGTALTAEIASGGFSFTHTLGKFRISATDADPSQFADGADNGGDLGAASIWTVLDPISVVSDNAGTTFMINPDGSILAGGSPAAFELYSVEFETMLDDITGFRLEALEDGTLPFDGPGRATGNGNFVVQEFSVFQSQIQAQAVPEPASVAIWSLIGIGLAGFGYYRLRRKT